MPQPHPDRSSPTSKAALPTRSEEQILEAASERVIVAAPGIKAALYEYIASMRTWKKDGSVGTAPELKIPSPESGGRWNLEEHASVQALINLYGKTATSSKPVRQKPPAQIKSVEELAAEIFDSMGSEGTAPHGSFSAQTLREVEAIKPEVPVKDDKKPTQADNAANAAAALSKYMKRPRN